MTPFRLSALAVAVAASIGLAGCGGGGGGSSSTPPPATPSQQTVTGSAVKGVLKNAIVTAWQLDAQGNRTTAVANTRTNTQGGYSLQLGSNFGGQVLEIVITTDSTTRMVCDASNCDGVSRGNDIELPDTFTLSALTVAPASAAAFSAPVTAWSTMAAKRAQALISAGGTPGAAARQANAEISDLVGFDIINTPATGLSQVSGASPEQGQSAVMNAAIAELLFGDSSSGDLVEKLERFAAAFEDGTFGDSEDAYSLEELATRTRDVAGSTPDLDSRTLDAINNKTTEYDARTDGYASTYDETLVVDDTASQNDKIAAFQSFVSKASTWFQSIEALDSDQLGLAVETDIETIQAIFNTTAQGQLQFIADALDATFTELLSDPEAAQLLLSEGGTRSFTLDNGEGQPEASLDLTLSDNEGLKINIEGSITLADQTTNVPFELELDTNLPASTLNLTTSTLSALAQSNRLTLSGSVKNPDGSDGLILDDIAIALELSAALNNGAGVTETQIAGAFSRATLAGAIEAYGPEGDHFKGEIGASLVRLNPNGVFFESLNMGPYSLSRLRIAGDFSGSNGNQFRTAASLNVNNASSFDTFAWLQYSNDRSGVDIPVPYDDFELLLTVDGQLEDAVFTNISVWQDRDASGQPFYRLNAGGWTVGDEPKFSGFGFFGDEFSSILDAVESYVASQFPSVVTLTYFDEQSEPQTFTLNRSQLFNGTRELRNLSGPITEQGVEEFFDLRVTTSSNLLPAGADGAFGAGTNGFEIGVSENPDGPGSVVRFDSRAAAAFNAVLNILDVPTPDVAENRSFTLNDLNGSGSYSFQIESRQDYFEACEQNPAGFLKFADASPFNCAERILFYTALDDRTLIDDEAALVDTIILNALTQRFGSALANQLETVGLFAYGDSRDQNGSFNLTVRYPDLETANRFLDSSLSVTSRINLPELREAQVTVTANRTSYRGGNLLANVRWEGGNYSIALTTTNAEDATAYRGRLFNNQGYELTFRVGLNSNGDINGLSGDAILNGETIGQLQLRNRMPVIRYPNGQEDVINTLL